MSCRSAIACLLVAAATSACDRPRSANQASPAAVAPGAVTSGEAAPGTSEAPALRFDRSHRGETPPTVGFTDPNGKPVTLAAFKGKPVLINLWATWCAPCVKELPTLAALAKKSKLRVVAVSQDSDPAKVAPFLNSHGLAGLQPYTDPGMALSLAYQANLPTTILIGADGRELWRRLGDVDWTGPEATRMVAEAQ